jgi:hypothetical protein
MNIFENITKAFDKPFKQFGIDNSIEACLENINCPTDVKTPYLSSFMLTAPTEEADLSVNEFRQGFYQVDINYASHLGSASINKMADLLNSTFKTGACFDFEDICLCVTSVDLSALIVEGGWAKRVMSVNWDTYTPRI